MKVLKIQGIVLPCIEYLDTEESYHKMIGTFNDLKTKVKHKKYTHCEIHPSLMLGLLSSLIPFSNHNQSLEILINLLGVNKLGVYMTNFNHRMDTVGHILYYPR